MNFVVPYKQWLVVIVSSNCPAASFVYVLGQLVRQQLER